MILVSNSKVWKSNFGQKNEIRYSENEIVNPGMEQLSPTETIHECLWMDGFSWPDGEDHFIVLAGRATSGLFF